ncbi:hypothetical protein SAMN05216198_2287 [Halopseudomonas litoralis]|uniref:Uncharacterized protein n=2 Tax=Halopseudomonas litoralis TaxID=797277 RepID=A0A1H1TEI6_9GAMM|nr:hypothetical protein SAMN05216198_2287 [Halopseudomonas litoralis]
MSLLTVLVVPYASADPIAVTEFRQQQVQLFDAQGKQPVERRDAASIQLPLEIADSLAGGFYVVKIGDQAYTVKKRTVRTNRVYELSSVCNNTVAATKAAASRGLGNGECE